MTIWMVDINAMISIKLYIKMLILIPCLLLGSCESLNNLAGLSKPSIEDNNSPKGVVPDLGIPEMIIGFLIFFIFLK